MARNLATPAEVLERLAESGYEVEVAGNASAPPSALARLTDSLLEPEPEPQEPDRDLTFDQVQKAEEAQRDQADRYRRLLRALVGNRTTLTNALRKLSGICAKEAWCGDPDDLFTSIAKHHNLTAEIARDLFDRSNVGYPAPEVRHAHERLARGLDPKSDSQA